MSTKTWGIEFSPECEKEWDRLDSSVQKRMLDFLSERIQRNEDPRLLAKPLAGNMKHFWRYRVGDYRIVWELKEKEMIISVVRVAHRRHVYD